MTELLTAAQMRAIEKAAIDSGQVTGLELMERAGRGVVEAVFEEWPELRATSHRAVVLCGPGNNGGDGFVVARLLREWGWEVEVFLYGDPSRLPPDARAAYDRWDQGVEGMLSMPVPSEKEVECLDKAGSTTVGTRGPSLIVDALFGTGLTRPIGGLSKALKAIQVTEPAAADGWWPRVVAIDIASGLCADSGRLLGEEAGLALGAHLTVAFHAMKPGHVLARGPEYSGKVVVADIGLGVSLTRNLRALARLHGIDVPARGMPRARRVVIDLVDRDSCPDLSKEAGHKYTHGHALILSGPPGHGGAARLTARGALRIGAGLVTVGCPPEALPENAARLDAVMLRPVHDTDALARVLEDRRINALCLGPGLGTGAREAGLVAAALGQRRPAVLDADALTLIARDAALFAALHEGCILTPHGGEFARLFPDIAERLVAPATKGPAFSKVDATREAAARAGCTVLFKGPDTVIAAPDGWAAINSAAYDRAAPWLATAGSGDVLAGFIAGLLARGFSPYNAACTAAWLHVECARSFGPGLIAEDLPEELPKVFRALGL